MSVGVPEPIEGDSACTEESAVCASTGGSVCDSPSAECLGSEPSSCPPPLGWKSVLTTVRDESQAWEISGKCGRVTGRTLGEGPPVYLLNGAGGTWELFALTMYLLQDEFRCVVVETPGEHSRFSVNDFTADLFQIADEQGDERFSLFAASYGSLAAFAAMNARPERIDRAVIQAGIADRRLSLTERLLVGLGKWFPVSLRRMPFFRRVQENNHRTWFPPFDKSRWEFLVDNAGSVTVRTLCRRISAFQKSDIAKSVSGLSQPVLLLGTEGEGAIAKRQREALQDRLSHTTTEMLPHCGLIPYLTHPHLLSKTLKKYLVESGEFKVES